ncbi:uncharacterized protein LOC131048477 [Cryptomeria japonica]|uniref:uncharacterized protein LOC131048477 n=1 Tax=Cryptomeria japonica TaxID=3369 RepID=UPI0027DA50CA|nr:uncharacterized protein LOC131048477 [Cryptomeria japonica]
MEEVDMDVKGSKLLRKFVKVCKRIVRSDARSRYSRLDTAADHSCTRSDSNRRPFQAADPSCTQSHSNRRPFHAADPSSTQSDSNRRLFQAADHSCSRSDSNRRPLHPADPSCTRSDSNRRPFQVSNSSCSCSDSNRRPLHTLSHTLSLPVASNQLHGPDSDANPKSSGNCFNLMADRKWYIRRRLSCRLSFVQRKEGNKVSNNIKNNCPPKDVPKGFIAVYVGDMQEEQTRFVIPVFYLNHPLFLHLLKETEQVYGFSQKGVFTIPCQVSDFEYLQWLIERERNQKLTP